MDDRFIGLDELIANAITIIPDVDDADRNIFRTWVYNCITDVGIIFSQIETEYITPEDLSLKKPDKFLSAIDLALFDSTDSELVYTFRGKGGVRIHTDDRGAESPRSIDVSEDDYYFHLGSNGDVVDYATLRYYRLPIDASGEIVVPYYFVEAVNMYIRWYWSLRKNDSRSEIEQNKNNYKEARAKVKAKNRAPSILEGKAITQAWMSMITRVQFNRF